MKYALGIDIGTSSLGVVAYALDAEDTPEEIIFCESYIFDEPVDSGTTGMATKNTARRAGRLVRRQHERVVRRYKKLAYLLPLLSVTKDDIVNIRMDSQFNIFALRAKAVKESISLTEFMCVLSHIGKNRGYKGNLKKEAGIVANNIKKLEQKLEERDIQTVGELWYIRQKEEHGLRAWKNFIATNDSQGTFVNRKMIEDEFSAIWKTQEQFHDILKGTYTVPSDTYFLNHKKGDILSLQDVFYDAIFAQRPIRWKVGTIGRCPYATGKRRASVGQDAFQQYRIVKKLRDITIMKLDRITKGYKGRELHQEEVRILTEYINAAIEEYTAGHVITFEKLYKKLNIDRSEYKFNIDKQETSDDCEGIKGNATKYAFYKAGIYPQFEELAVEVQEVLIEFLSCATDYDGILDNREESLKESIRTLTEEKNDDVIHAVYRFLVEYIKPCLEKEEKSFSIESGRASYSVEVLKKLVQELLNPTIKIEEGKNITEYAILEAFYPKTKEERTQLRPLSTVQTGNPIIDRVLREFKQKIEYVMLRLGKRYNNVDDAGKVQALAPTRITIETSRDLKNSLAQRTELEKEQKEYAKERIEAKKELAGHFTTINGTNILRYRLWKEQDHKCTYCDGEMSFTQAMSAETEIDHIIPQARGGENRYRNKTLCHKACNNGECGKGNRTPYEAWQAGTNVSSDAVKKMAERLEAKAKKCRKNIGGKWKYTLQGRDLLHKAKMLVTNKSAEDLTMSFSDRAGNETSWISKILLDWCKDICLNDVVSSTGTLTAYFRSVLGIDLILPKLRLQEGKKLIYLIKETGKCEEIEDVEKWKEVWGLQSPKLEESPLKEEYEVWKLTRIGQVDKHQNPLKDDFETFKKTLRGNEEYQFYKRCDHRHHAIDALVIALCTRSMGQEAAKYKRDHHSLRYRKENTVTGEVIEFLPTLRLEKIRKAIIEQAEKLLLNYVVWHKADYFPSGAFFEETAYGVVQKTEIWNKAKGKETRNLLYSRKSLKSIFKVGTKDEIKTLDKVKDVLDKNVVTKGIREHIKKTIEHEMNQGKTLKEIIEGIEYEKNIIKKVKCYYKQLKPSCLVHQAKIEDNTVVWENVVGDSTIDTKKSYKVYYNQGYACMEFYTQPPLVLDIESTQYWDLLEVYKKDIPEATALPIEECEKHNAYIAMKIEEYKKTEAKPKKARIKELEKEYIPRKKGDGKKGISYFAYQKQLLEYQKEYPKAKRLPRFEFDIHSERYQELLAEYKQEYPHVKKLPIEYCEENNSNWKEILEDYKRKYEKPNTEQKEEILHLENNCIPEIIRVFVNDMIFSKKTKEFYYVFKYDERGGIVTCLSTEVNNLPKELVSITTWGDIKKFIIVRDRKHLAELKASISRADSIEYVEEGEDVEKSIE